MGNTTSSSTDLTLSSVKMIIVVVQVFLTHFLPVFFTSLSVFRNQRINTFECLNLLLKLIHILSENRD